MKEIDRRQGKFGEIHVKERLRDGARLYCVGDSVQTMSTPDGTSLFGYIHATKLLLGDAKDVLMLGGGGGSLATMLARRGFCGSRRQFLRTLGETGARYLVSLRKGRLSILEHTNRAPFLRNSALALRRKPFARLSRR